jgi:hypothetical protein
MGFQSSSVATNATYFTLSDGKCRIRLREATAESVSRVTKDGNTVHELVHDEFTGLVRAIEVADTDFGKQWRITFVDAPYTYVLTLKYSSNYARTLIQALCNPEWDATLDTTVKPYSFSPKDDASRVITGCTVSQRGKKIERLYCSSINPVDGKIILPDLEKVKVRGQEIWDDTKQMDFLLSEFQAKVSPKLQRNERVVTVNETLPPAHGDDDAALPF